MKRAARLSFLLAVSLPVFTPAIVWSAGDDSAASRDDARESRRAQMHEKWDSMSPDQQAQARQHFKERYEKASPEEKEKMRSHVKMRRELRRHKDKAAAPPIPAAGQ